MNLMPHPIVISSIAAGMSIFGFVLWFFRHPRHGLSAMQRLYLSWLCGALVWLTCLMHQLPLGRALASDLEQNLVCGGLVLWCFIWGSYWFANLGGGFRVLMLLDLDKSEHPITFEEWMAEYGQKRGMREFLEDRLRSILVPLNLVDLESDRVVLTNSRGRLLAKLLDILSAALLKGQR